MELDARSLGVAGVDADVCVVGAGPAGLTLARELAARGRRVIVLESGGRNPDPEAQALGEGTTSGDAYAGPGATRHRQAGGTAQIWNTPFGDGMGAKYVPLDAVDFEARSWWPLSGWPFDRSHLDRYYTRAQAFCGLGRPAYRGEDWQTGERPCLPLSPGPLTTAVYQLGSSRLFTQVHVDEIRRAANVLLCLNATVVEVAPGAGGRAIAHVGAGCAVGRILRVRAPLFVLAAGGIENARLLLLAGRAGSVADASGMVGRCFMEHPRDVSCRLVLAEPAAIARCGLYDVHEGDGGVVMGRLALTDEARRRHELPAVSITLLRRDPGWWRRPRRRRRPAGVDLLINVEQAPDPDNRITLGAERDRYDLPRAAIHWRWRELDQRNLRRVHVLVSEELARHGLGRVEMAAAAPPDPNAHHHMGTTRMHRDPRYGVVDEHARVHGIANLYVAGSSVFPTCGSANPTLTIVALALRLAEHLDARLRQPHA